MADINQLTYKQIVTTRVFESYLKHKGLCAILAAAFGGVGVYTYQQLNSPEIQAQINSSKDKQNASVVEGAKGKERARSRSVTPAVDKLFLKRLAFVLRIVAVMEKSWKKFAYCMADFYVTGCAASVVNSALKYLTNSITVSFRQRLT
eukprot:gene27049-33277_t